MSFVRSGIVLTLGLSFLTGCRSTSIARRTHSPAIRIASDSNSAAESNLAVSHKTASAEAADGASAIQQTSATAADSTSEMIQPIVVRLSIRAAIETSLAQNPDLIALREAEGVGNAALGVAQTYPFNPFVQAQATPYQSANGGGPGTTYHYVLLMQQIQLAHQQTHREQAACAALNSIRWNVVQAELLNVAQTERLYFAALYQRGLRNLARINADNNRQLLSILQSQLEAGDATAADVAIVRLDSRSTQQQLRLAEANLQTAMLDLKRHLCLEPNTKLELDDEISKWNWRPADPLQLAELSGNRPDVQAARADADTARANTNFANASRIPDLQIGPYYQRTDAGTTFLGLRAQMDIPVINNGIPLLRQREAELTQRTMTAQQLAVRARLEAEAATDRYERARQMVAMSTDTQDNSLPQELQNLEKQFKAQEVDILRVIQARTSLLQNQRADLDALNELLQSAVAITAASGCPLESLVSASE